MFLVDTNVWLERLLDRDKSEEVRDFLDSVSSEQLFITDFAFHSIGLIMHRLDALEDFLRFVQDVFLDGAVEVIHLGPADMKGVTAAMNEFNLDFDDAYQCQAAQKHRLALVSYDSDFDRTVRGRVTLGRALASP